MEKFRFYVHTRGDRQVGISPVDDVIDVVVESGDPGGDVGEFEKYLCECLSEWYDEPGSVSLKSPDAWGPEVDYDEGDGR